MKIEISYENNYLEKLSAKKAVSEYILRYNASYPLPPHVALWVDNTELTAKDVFSLAKKLKVPCKVLKK